MPRPLRIEYEYAWYHVMNRGAGSRSVFLSDKYYQIFLDLLQEVSQSFCAEIHAYCLMKNHYHLLIRTPCANLSRIMRHINGVYTQRFNRITKSDGSLFRGRYKALLIDADTYLLQVSRYIHLNPVLAGIVKNPEDYAWSSYSSYINKAEQIGWLYIDEVLGCINSKTPIMHYQQYIAQGLDEETQKFYNKKKQSIIIGSKAFKNLHLEDLDNKLIYESKHELKRSRAIPAIDNILEYISLYYKTDIKFLKSSKRGQQNLPRNMAVLISRMEYGYKNCEIATCFTGITASAVSAMVCNLRKGMEKNYELQKEYNAIVTNLKRYNLQTDT